jgi:predicted ATPase
MITELRVQNFKSWRDTGALRLAPITGLFGTNSSGKTAILQFLLLLKQTVESLDRARVLHLGDERTYVDLGTFADVIYGHETPGIIDLELSWKLPKPRRIANPQGPPNRPLFETNGLTFSARVEGNGSNIQVVHFDYRPETAARPYRFGMQRRGNGNGDGRPSDRAGYDLIADGYEPKRTPGRPYPLPPPVKCYGFPDQVSGYYQNMGFVSAFALEFEEAFANIYYLGPLREYPHRSYLWAGDQPVGVGQRGELAVHALLAARERGITLGRGRGYRRQNLDERVAEWLRALGLIDSFKLSPIAPNRKEYEVKVQRTRRSPEVLITDVGFGVSQILPVLTLCYYAPEGSTIILEQPEIHLHPSVQAGLADVFIDVALSRKLQIILESHSEHLLRRLQRRVAEKKLGPERTALYFVSTRNGASVAEPLELDLFGNIRNWPENFFGDELGDLVAMTEAAMSRQHNGAGTTE